MNGIKHLIECHCVLPQYRNSTNPVFHKFVVFSIIDNSDTVIPKYVQCNNCDVVHKVFDICKSEIAMGKDELRAVIRKEEILLGMRQDVISVLESYNVDLPTWENVKFILDNKKWGSFVVLAKDTLDNEDTGKALVFESAEKFKIETFITKSLISAKDFS